MQPKYVLIAGSAAQDCDGEKLAMATQFVAAVTQEILHTGNSLAVLASREPTRAEPDGPVSLTFDWTALRTIAQHLEDSSENSGRILARVVTGADSIRKRFSPENARLIQLLQAKGAIDVRHIEENLYYGGSYRELQSDLADALIVVGGGKGAYVIGDQMLQAGKPVMPMDILIGSRHGDGDGALQLLSEMKTAPEVFLPRNHEVVNRNLYALSLEQPIWSAQRIAYTTAAILADELNACDDGNGKPRRGIWELLNKLARKTPPAAQSAYHATRTAETISNLFN